NIVLEGGIADADDRHSDHNFRNRLATHTCPLPKTARVALKIRLLSKTPGKIIILVVRWSIIPSYSGVMNLSINAACPPGARLCADRGNFRRTGNHLDPFRGIALKYAQELWRGLLEITRRIA